MLYIGLKFGIEVYYIPIYSMSYDMVYLLLILPSGVLMFAMVAIPPFLMFMPLMVSDMIVFPFVPVMRHEIFLLANVCAE